MITFETEGFSEVSQYCEGVIGWDRLKGVGIKPLFIYFFRGGQGHFYRFRFLEETIFFFVGEGFQFIGTFKPRNLQPRN